MAEERGRSVWVLVDACEQLQLFWTENLELLVTGEKNNTYLF